ncbi:MAG: TonB-dependent receptor [Bdellovibrionales bacterium]|jgi:vitamin B12 transporter|nr:TonB-dependent receptor [Bdellovibrionales bacterium]
MTRVSGFLKIALFALAPFSVFAEAETPVPTVVIESRSPNPNELERSRSITIITAADIEKKKPLTVADLLRDVPGLELIRQGSTGQTTSIFVRGARSEGTLVLIDGIEANDAMSPGCGFDFASLSTDGISRIAVFRGPQSVRYGAGALGGVISITTKDGFTNTAQANAFRYRLETGSYQTFRASSGGTATTAMFGIPFSVTLGLDHLQTEGVSAALVSSTGRDGEKDATDTNTASLKASLQPTRNTQIDASIRYANARVDIDRHGGPDGDDPNNVSRSQQLFSGLSLTQRSFADRLKTTAGFFFSETDRETENKPDNQPGYSDTTDSRDHFISETRKLQLDNEFVITDHHTLLFSFQWREESGHAHSTFNGSSSTLDRRTQSISGFGTTYLYESKTWFSDLGARVDQSSVVGNIASYRLAFGRNFFDGSTKASVAYGTGFKLPSLYQLYSMYGDRNLQQEHSNVLEFSLEHSIFDLAHASITVFDSEFIDLIDYSMTTNRYFNVSEARNQGLESELQVKFDEVLSLTLTYAYLESQDKSTGLGLLRRPRHATSAAFTYKPDIKSEISIRYRRRGERPDIDPVSFNRVTNPSYDVLDLGTGVEVLQDVTLHARIENILDTRYEEVAGYGTPGRSFYVVLSGAL